MDCRLLRFTDSMAEGCERDGRRNADAVLERPDGLLGRRGV
jgi:hypothetical protein